MSGSGTGAPVAELPGTTWVTDSRFPLNDFRSFNSPFEVLFNFPSGYLFAIDLSSVFSHGWRLPPYLRSTPTERDSKTTKPYAYHLYQRQGYHLLRHVVADILDREINWH